MPSYGGICWGFMKIIVEKQSTNFCLNSDNPKWQHIPYQFALCISCRAGLVIITKRRLWKFWHWEIVRKNKPLVTTGSFLLYPVFARHVQVEDSYSPTSYISTDYTPQTREESWIILTLNRYKTSKGEFTCSRIKQ